MNHLISLLIGFSGVLIGAGISLLIAWQNRRAEDHRHHRELAVSIAVAQFDHACKLSQHLANLTRQIVEVPPFAAFVHQALEMLEILNDSGISTAELGARLADLGPLTQELQAAIKQATKQGRM